jgi:hypothetical protein
MIMVPMEQIQNWYYRWCRRKIANQCKSITAAGFHVCSCYQHQQVLCIAGQRVLCNNNYHYNIKGVYQLFYYYYE